MIIKHARLLVLHKRISKPSYLVLNFLDVMEHDDWRDLDLAGLDILASSVLPGKLSIQSNARSRDRNAPETIQTRLDTKQQSSHHGIYEGVDAHSKTRTSGIPRHEHIQKRTMLDSQEIGKERAQNLAHSQATWSASLGNTALRIVRNPRRQDPDRNISRYSESKEDELLDFLCLPGKTKSTRDQATQLQQRLRQGLQPRRHQASPSRVDAISRWQASQALDRDNEFDDLILPTKSSLTLPPRVGRSTHQIDVESGEDWGESSLGNQHVSTTPRSQRLSTGSSSLSLSMSSTAASGDDMEGLEFHDNVIDLKQRFRDNTARRQACGTVKLTARPLKFEDLTDGLVIENDSFSRAPVRLTKAGPALGSVSHDYPHVHESGPRSRVSEIPRRSNDAFESAGRLTSTGTHFNATHTSVASALTPARKSLLSVTGKTVPYRPVFLPAGPAGDSSHHVTALNQRYDRTADNLQGSATTKYSLRRATASEALRREASRYSVRTHVRAKTYGDGHELDDLEDIPTNTNVSSAYSHTGEAKMKTQHSHTHVKSRPLENEHSKVQTKGAQVRMSSRLMQGENKYQQSRPPAPRYSSKIKKKTTLPGLISGINSKPVARTEKSMVYNPETFSWEGNEEILRNFDAAAHSVTKPALIANVSSEKSVQVVNGMVFDPEHKCWINLEDQDEFDPFAELDDLEIDSSGQGTFEHKVRGSARPTLDHFTVGEEFDVGRQFIRKQRAEELQWKQQSSGWIDGGEVPDRNDLQEIYALLIEDD